VPIQRRSVPPSLCLPEFSGPHIFREAMASGADDIISKPVDLPDLVIRIRALLACWTIEEPGERFARYYEIIRQGFSPCSVDTNGRRRQRAGCDQPIGTL
jgi:DNA-binding response OmpR family regulator